MGGEWSRARLGDLVSIKHGWPFKSELFSLDRLGRPIVVSIGNFQYTGGFRFESTAIKEYAGEYPREYELTPGDILLVMTCQTAGGEILGIPARVPNDGRVYLHNQRMGLVVPRNGNVDPAFLYWLFLYRDFNLHLVSSASGTKILHTAPSRIESFEFDLPPLAEQRAIARILGALNDKIELNRKLNATLEAMARALFKSWFVDFDPVRAKAEGRAPSGMDAETARLFPNALVESQLGPIPKGWRVGSIYELSSVDYGAPYASSRFNTEKRGLPVVRIRDLVDQTPAIWTDEEHARAVRLADGDVVVGMDGEFRAHLWGSGPALLNQRACRFSPRDAKDGTFVRLSVGPCLEFVERTEVATTVIHLGKSDIDQFRVVIPSRAILDAFAIIAGPFIEKQIVTSHESRSLVRIRDVLLPRLVSGELSVAQAELVGGPS